MSGLNTLRRDHDTIGTMLGVLEASVDRLGEGQYVDAQMLSGILRFFEQIVGKCHQAQEETALFPLLTLPEEGVAMVATLMRQHACQRESLGLVADALRQLQRGEGGALDALTFNVRAYGARVRAHLLVEDLFFTDIAAAVVTAEDEELLREFNSIERAAIGATGREWYNQLVSDYRDITSTWAHWPDIRNPEPRRLPGHGRA
jgi:hemerythrin-like domain-containing protein